MANLKNTLDRYLSKIICHNHDDLSSAISASAYGITYSEENFDELNINHDPITEDLNILSICRKNWIDTTNKYGMGIGYEFTNGLYRNELYTWIFFDHLNFQDADEVLLDNTINGLTATHVQEAFDELVVLGLIKDSKLSSAANDAITKQHDQNTDIGLDIGGVNELSAATIKNHILNTNNPHSTTANHIGADNIINEINFNGTNVLESPDDSAPLNDVQYANKKYVDDSVLAENLWDRTGTVLSPHNVGDNIEIDGKLGVGTTSPVGTIEAEGNIIAKYSLSTSHPNYANGYIELYVYRSGGNSYGRILPYNGSSYIDLAIGDWGGGNPNIMLKTGGNVGINYGTPDAKLSVKGVGTSDIFNLRDLSNNKVFTVFDDGGIKHESGSFWCDGITGSTPTSGAGTRLMWIPEKAAFRAGKVLSNQWDDYNIGNDSVALGFNAKASGARSVVLGSGIANGNNSIAFGNATANATESIAIGNNAIANGSQSIAAGSNANASGAQSFCTGFNCDTIGAQSFAVGYQCQANGQASFVAGYNAITNGLASVALGELVVATADYSLALGKITNARLEGGITQAVGRFRENYDAQTIVGILYGEMVAYGNVTLSNPQDYSVPADTTILYEAHTVWRADDGTSAMSVIRGLFKNSFGTVTQIGTTQTIGIDVDPSAIIDTIDFAISGTDVQIKCVCNYNDDIGVVAKIRIVENAYTAPSGT